MKFPLDHVVVHFDKDIVIARNRAKEITEREKQESTRISQIEAEYETKLEEMVTTAKEEKKQLSEKIAELKGKEETIDELNEKVQKLNATYETEFKEINNEYNNLLVEYFVTLYKISEKEAQQYIDKYKTKDKIKERIKTELNKSGAGSLNGHSINADFNVSIKEQKSVVKNRLSRLSGLS